MNEQDITEALKRIRTAQLAGIAGALVRIGDAFHAAARAMERTGR